MRETGKVRGPKRRLRRRSERIEKVRISRGRRSKMGGERSNRGSGSRMWGYFKKKEGLYSGVCGNGVFS